MADKFRVVIVGSGPAGMSAAGRAAQLKLKHVLLEKTDHLSDTIYKYQKGKHVMATPSQLVLRSDMEFDAGKREAILETWDKQTDVCGVNVQYNAEPIKIEGEEGSFTITLKNGDKILTETIVIAIGTQGNPNLMRCPGGDNKLVQYQLDDPGEYYDEHITVIGSGDAGIENALGLAADAAQNNIVTILNRSAEFARAKKANVKLLMEAGEQGKVMIRNETTPSEVKDGELVLETRDGQETIKCDRIIARMGSAPPRKFVEECGIEFTSEDREAYPKLSPAFESTKNGIYVIGALAGYPLIKHCMNQGYDVIEFINGNEELKPADEPILEKKFAALPGGKTVEEWLEFFREKVTILNDLSPLQMREFMLDSEPLAYRKDDIIFERNDPGSSLFTIAQGSVLVEIDSNDSSKVIPIEEGSIFGEVGLISGRRRGATIRAAEDVIAIEVSRTAALKLQASVPAAKRAITRISTERQLLQMFGSGLTKEDIAEAVETSEIVNVRAGETIINEGDDGNDIYVIRVGSMVVEKEIGGKPVFLSYLPAGSYVGEMTLIAGGMRTATVKAAIKSEVIKIQGDAFKKVLDAHPDLLRRAKKDMAARQDINAFVEAKKDSFSGVVDYYSGVANFLVDNGIGEATDVLLIDENLCVGCDNCEKACADSHEGLSRLDREAGRTYAHLHVPTSCRHCEHPHCMSDCPPDAIHRGPDGEVFIDDSCIGCGNCQRYCPYGVIRMDKVPPKKPSVLNWLLFGFGPGPGEPDKKWVADHSDPAVEKPKKAIKCDMCAGIKGGPACVRACPTGAAIRVAPEEFLTVSKLEQEGV
ncbi:MAG: cyclic nucleotide-binding domain-containing protein [Parasphingorhabdus sp.]